MINIKTNFNTRGEKEVVVMPYEYDCVDNIFPEVDIAFDAEE